VTLTAQDVHDRQFRLVRQSTGYDIDEVDSFLEEVEAELRRLQTELDAARGGGPSPTAGAQTGGDQAAGTSKSSAQSGGLGSVVEAPASAAARILELAQRTADEYLAEAQRHAERIRSEAAGMEARATELRGYESELRGRLRGYFNTELDQLRKVLGED